MVTFAFEDPDGHGGYASFDADSWVDAVRQFRLMFGAGFRIVYLLGS